MTVSSKWLFFSLAGTTLILSSAMAGQTAPSAHNHPTAGPPAPRTFSDQAKSGKKKYAENCAMCHAENLKGRDPAPALTGARFMKKWQGKTLWDLFDKVRKTMPQQDRGSLTPRSYLEIVAYLAKFNSFDVGEAELKNDPKLLKGLVIAKPANKVGSLAGSGGPIPAM